MLRGSVEGPATAGTAVNQTPDKINHPRVMNPTVGMGRDGSIEISSMSTQRLSGPFTREALDRTNQFH
jgi:hypothetical protein